MVQWLNGIALRRKLISELQSVTCRMGSHVLSGTRGTRHR